MAERDFLGHENPDGEDSRARMLRAGFVGLATGENIVEAVDTAEAVVERFMESAPHCGNIMNERFQALGVGYFPGGQFGHLWTVTFGG
jgi:uncharacterized protein YkwD